MTFLYLILGAILVFAAVAWMRLSRATQEEELESKVEPDLNDLFETTAQESAENRVEFSDEAVSPQKEGEYFEPIESTQQFSEELVALQEEAIFDLDSNIHELAAEAARKEELEAEARAAMGISMSYDDEPTQPENSPRSESYERAEPESTETVENPLNTPAVLSRDRRSRFEEKAGLLGGIKKLFGSKRETADFSHDKTFLRPATIESYGFILKAPEEQPYTFREIFEVAAEIGLSARNNDFLEYVTTTHWGDEEMYQVAHLLGDGKFSQEIIEYHLDDAVPGLFFFSKIPGADPDIPAIEYLMAGIEVYMNSLGGEILSSDKEPLSKEQLAERYIDIAKREKEAWDRAFDSQYS